MNTFECCTDCIFRKYDCHIDCIAYINALKKNEVNKSSYAKYKQLDVMSRTHEDMYINAIKRNFNPKKHK